MDEQRSFLPLYLFVALVFYYGFTNGFYKEAVYGYSQSLFWVQDFVGFVIIPILGFSFLHHFGWKASDFAVKLPANGLDWFHTFMLSLFLTVILWYLYRTVVETSYRSYDFSQPSFYFSLAIPEDQPARALFAIYSAATAGVVEEFTYKGAFFPILKKLNGSRLGTIVLALISAILFSAIHWENGYAELAGTFVYGFVGFLLFAKIRLLLPFVIGHTVIDLWHFW